MPEKPPSPPSTSAKTPSLEQLLRREDIWRGHSHSFVNQTTQSSGHVALDNALQHKGWPINSLIEVCQAYHACDWWLFHPAAKALCEANNGYIVLLNPPALPFQQGLEQYNIDTKRLLIVQPRTNAEFIAGFSELSQCSACSVLLAWQPQSALNYTAMRKLHLSSLEGRGLYAIFRPLQARQQSSPANLRIQVAPQKNHIALSIFKQKGKLQEVTLDLPTPPSWQTYPLHRFLGTNQATHTHGNAVKRSNIVALPQKSGVRRP